jgi:hypothetical protein
MTKNKGQKIMEFNFDITELRRFLQDELRIPSAELALVMQKKEELNGPIPMLLWQYGFISCLELERIFDWLEAQSPLKLLNIKEQSYVAYSD